jgi:hypothetical protein
LRQIEQWQCITMPSGAVTSNTTPPQRHRPWTIGIGVRPWVDVRQVAGPPSPLAVASARDLR